jgi:heat shock protein HslJ
MWMVASITVLPIADLHAEPAAEPGPAVGFALPATFAGVMPCADCAGVAQTLTLRADGLYRLRRTYLDKPDGPFAELGRWRVDESGTRLTLRSGSEILLFEVKDHTTLRLLDRLGQPITSKANLDLRRTVQVEPISELLRWRGEFRYLADAAMFTDCASGLRWPVAMTADYLTMERNYLKSRSAPTKSLLVSFEGRLEVRPSMEGPPREQMVVDRFGGSQPWATCGPATSGKGDVMAELKDTYWKLIELDGETIVMAPDQQREVRITLASEGARFFGFSGCNQLVGAYVQEGSALRFTQVASTKMACVPPFMELESQVLKMLGATTAYRIEGEQLTLLGGNQVLARFEAVYLR